MAEILIYDIIGGDWFGEGVTDKSVKSALDSVKDGEEVTVRINSPGGDVFQGFAIYNLLKQHQSHVRVVVDGWAASAASIIAMAGDSVEMANNTMLMIHNPWTFAIGESGDMIKTAERLDKIKDSIVASYEPRTHLTSEEISDAMDEETWYSAAEAVELGFADKIIDEEAQIENKSTPWIKNAPQPEKVERKPPDLRIAARARLNELVS